MVSEAVAKEMAEGIRKQMNADYAISSTGYASAALDNAVEYPVGSCYIGLASAESVIAKHYQFEGDRDTIIHHASTAALSLLKDQLRFKV